MPENGQSDKMIRDTQVKEMRSQVIEKIICVQLVGSCCVIEVQPGAL